MDKQTKRAYEMAVEDYVRQRHDEWLNKATRQVEEWHRAAIDPTARRNSRERAAYQEQLWRRDLARADTMLARKRVDYERDYYRAVDCAIRARVSIPAHIVERDPRVGKAVTAYERYLKGRETSFSNVKNAVVIDAGAGYKVKLQSGKPVTQPHLDYITRGVTEVEQAMRAVGVVDTLSNVFRKVNLTIAHTDGKRPFMRAQAAGLYSIRERTISVGTVVWGRPIHALAHEIAHMLDHEAAFATNGNAASLVRSRALQARQPEFRKVLREASWRMNHLSRIESVFDSATLYKTDADKQQADVCRVQLGQYWRREEEIWARLVEQRLSLALPGAQAGFERDYTGHAGYWTLDRFEPWVQVIDDALCEVVRLILNEPQDQEPGDAMTHAHVNLRMP